MDDSKFDDIIKGRVGEYEVPEFDPSAMASLHHKMATMHVMPWYSRFRSEMILGGSMLLMTTLLLWFQNQWHNESLSNMRSNMEELQLQNDKLNRLHEEVLTLASRKPDTIRILQIQNGSRERIASLEYRIDQLESTQNDHEYGDLIYLGSAGEIPDEFIDEIERSGFIRRQGDKIYLSANSLMISEVSKIDFETIDGANSPNITFTDISNEEHTDTDNSTQNKAISAKTLRALNKHYRSGIGFKLGPMADWTVGVYDVGSPKAAFGVGGISELVLSPSLSLEIGAKYNYRSREIKSDFQDLEIPGIDPSNITGVHEIYFNSHIIDIPVNLKYHYQLRNRYALVGALGYSYFIYPAESLIFENESGSPQPNPYDNQSFGTATYPGSLNFILGLNRSIKERQSIEGSLVYQHSLNEKGFDSANVDYFGLRLIYWYLLR